MKEGLMRKGLLLLLLFFSFRVLGVVEPSSESAYQSSPSSWLKKMSDASRRLSYRGVFVYQEGARLETLSVTRDVTAGRDRQQIVYLDGRRREMLRNKNGLVYSGSEGEVTRYNYGASPVPMVGKFFQVVSGRYYQVRYAKRQLERIAGREAVVLDLAPTDHYRYGFQLWLDTQSGLLLKSIMFDKEKIIRERLQFTHIETDITLSAEELASLDKSTIKSGNMIDSAMSPKQALVWEWEANWLPDGFNLQNVTQRVSAVTKHKIDAVIYSDGVANFSVFVEPDETGVLSQVSENVGAMSAVLKVFKRDGRYFHVTVIGEVPLATAEGVAASIGPARRK